MLLDGVSQHSSHSASDEESIFVVNISDSDSTRAYTDSISSNSSQASLQFDDDNVDDNNTAGENNITQYDTKRQPQIVVNSIPVTDEQKSFWLDGDKCYVQWHNKLFKSESESKFVIRLSSGGVLNTNVQSYRILEETSSELKLYESGKLLEAGDYKGENPPIEISVPNSYTMDDEYDNDDDTNDVNEMDDEIVPVSNDFSDDSNNLIPDDLMFLPYSDYSEERIGEWVSETTITSWKSGKLNKTKLNVSKSKSDEIVKKKRDMRVHGLSLGERIQVTVIDHKKPRLTDIRLLEKLSGVSLKSQKHDHDTVEIEQTIVYTISEEIIRSILIDLIHTFPTPSLIALNLPPPKQPPIVYQYFTPDEVVIHNKPDDIWVSYLNCVYDLTPLVKQYENKIESRPLIAFAGKDISHWFDDNGEIRHCIHPVTGVRVPYLPHGPIPDIFPQVPATTWEPIPCPCRCTEPTTFVPWWKDKKYLKGKLTECVRPIRILNMLTKDECTLRVCKEDTLQRILERLAPFNRHAASYVWKYETRVLDMTKTLDENAIYDEREKFADLFLPDDLYTPAICLYFKDDFLWDYDTDESTDND